MGFTGAHVLCIFDVFILALYLLSHVCALLKYTSKLSKKILNLNPHTLGKACAYLGHILDLSWAIAGHISGIYIRKPLSNWHFSGDKLSHPTKCPTFSPATKCPNLCTDAQESCWKVVGTFCRLSQLCGKQLQGCSAERSGRKALLSHLSFFYILVANINIMMSPNRKISP